MNFANNSYTKTAKQGLTTLLDEPVHIAQS